MKDSIYPGEIMRFSGVVTGMEPVDAAIGWIDVAIELHADEKRCVDCEARIAVPRTAEGNPWKLRGDAWRP